MGYCRSEPHGRAHPAVPHCRHAVHTPTSTRWTQEEKLCSIRWDSMAASGGGGHMQVASSSSLPPTIRALSTLTLPPSLSQRRDYQRLPSLLSPKDGIINVYPHSLTHPGRYNHRCTHTQGGITHRCTHTERHTHPGIHHC